MLKTYTFPEYAYRQSLEQRSGQAQRRPLVIVGAGPVGLTAALDCARRGIPVVVLDDNNSVSMGSRAVCYAKRTLEVLDRLGIGEALAEQGIKWRIGKVFFREELAYLFDLLPQPQHKMPAMINLQQYHLEERLVRACQLEPLIELRWKHKLIGLSQDSDGVKLEVQTPDGLFEMQSDWLIACDGAGSDTRAMLGLEFEGQVFHDRFLIADVVMNVDLAEEMKPPVNGCVDSPPRARGSGLRRLGTEPERWFWFDPPFHRGQSVLLHKQCDKVWRIDFQLGRDADPVQEKRPEKVMPRIQAMLGPDVQFELEWVSVYQFACRRMKNFRHGRVLFAGDAAHQVSPFGARGANSGMQDADNLGWKLQAVLEGRAPERLLDSYHFERAAAADDNIANSTRSTDFISPKSRASLRLRNAVLELARTEAFARPLVNSGRLSRPTPYAESPLTTPDDDDFEAGVPPGSPCVDAPLDDGRWLLNALGQGFVLISFGAAVDCELPVLQVDLGTVAAERYGARPGTCYLVRPDQYVAARWHRFDAARVQAALQRSLGVH